MPKNKKVATLPLDAPEGYTAEQLEGISAEDDHARACVHEDLLRVLVGHQARLEAAFVVPDGVIEVRYADGQERVVLQELEARLKAWTLTRNYAHYCVCADGVTMFAGNFDDYSAVFSVNVRTGSDADRWLMRLMTRNPGWSDTSTHSAPEQPLDR